MLVCVLPHTAVRIVGYMQGDWDGTGTLGSQGGHCFLGLTLTAWRLHPCTAQVRELTELHALLLLHRRTTHSSYRSFWKHTTYIRLNITVLYSFLSVLQNKTMNMFWQFPFGFPPHIEAHAYTTLVIVRFYTNLWNPWIMVHRWDIFLFCVLPSPFQVFQIQSITVSILVLQLSLPVFYLLWLFTGVGRWGKHEITCFD